VEDISKLQHRERRRVISRQEILAVLQPKPTLFMLPAIVQNRDKQLYLHFPELSFEFAYQECLKDPLKKSVLIEVIMLTVVHGVSLQRL